MSPISKVMKNLGWYAANSGVMRYVKKTVLPDGRPGFITITAIEGCALPTSEDDEVLVEYLDQDMRSYREGELDWHGQLLLLNLFYDRGMTHEHPIL